MKKIVGALVIPAFMVVSGCVVAPVHEDPWGAPPPPPMVVPQNTVHVPVVYGEPCYYSPPMTVSYVYDYFTYENVGAYVNIVFWRNGSRYRSEPWYNNGRRMDHGRVQEWQRNHRIPAQQFERHRESLRKSHNISRPDPLQGKRPASPGQQHGGGKVAPPKHNTNVRKPVIAPQKPNVQPKAPQRSPQTNLQQRNQLQQQKPQIPQAGRPKVQPVQRDTKNPQRPDKQPPQQKQPQQKQQQPQKQEKQQRPQQQQQQSKRQGEPGKKPGQPFKR